MNKLSIKELRLKLGVTQKELSELVGVSVATIQNWEYGGSIPKTKHKILCSMFNEGSMLTATDGVNQTGDTSKPFALVPLINVDSVGGVHSDNAITISEQYTIRKIPFTDAREGDVAILQSGNSMSPTIPSGSVLLIRQVADWREFLGYGNIYVLWLGDGRRITKEIRRYDPDPQNYVLCVSYNPDVADEPLPRSFIRGVWKVVKYLADFGW